MEAKNSKYLRTIRYFPIIYIFTYNYFMAIRNNKTGYKAVMAPELKMFSYY